MSHGAAGSTAGDGLGRARVVAAATRDPRSSSVVAFAMHHVAIR
jgi:hypothetical protein